MTGGLNSPTVLLVDNDPIYQRTLEAALTKLGLRAVVAGSSQEFLEKDMDLDPQLYLIDLQIETAESGFELVKKIRATRRSGFHRGRERRLVVDGF